MDKWINSQAGKLLIDEKTGQIKKIHPHKYYKVANKTIKVTLDTEGKEVDAEFYGQKAFLYVHPDTGKIVGHFIGFIESVELNESTSPIKVTCPDGKEAKIVELEGHNICPTCQAVRNHKHDKILPVDFLQGKHKEKYGYKWDKTKKEFEKLID